MKTIERIDCGASLAMQDLDEMYPKLLTLLIEERQVIFDCSQIAHIDTAALQTLYAFSQASLHYGCTVNWDRASDIFIHKASLLGVANAMGLSVGHKDGVQQ